jgi:hypothetical protein
MKPATRRLVILFIVLGSALRLLLWWVNPPVNSFDNHFEPIILMLQRGTIPAKDACFQCYHPPVFYMISAEVGSIAEGAGMRGRPLLKLLQLLPCFYGILTLIVIHRILLKLPLNDFARMTSLAAVCFLPRHIYMSAMNSNDTISYLFVAISVDLLLLAVEKKLSAALLIIASMAITVTLFTKYTAFAILPACAAVFGVLFWKRLIANRPQVVLSFGFVMLLPAIVLSASMVSNFERYGAALPWNLSRLDPSRTQPRDSSRMDFLSFKPWESITMPILVPGRIHSVWTLVYAGMWFDNEPKFVYYLDGISPWWRHYGGWMRGEEPFPAGDPAMTGATRFLGSSLIALGLIPFGLMLYGIYVLCRKIGTAWREGSNADKINAVKLSVFPGLLLGNLAIAVALAVRLPVYSAAKASYMLTSLPAFAVFLGFGVMRVDEDSAWRWAVAGAGGLLFVLVTAHIAQIAYALL